MRIMNVRVPSINESENINVCDTVYSTAHFCNQFHCTE